MSGKETPWSTTVGEWIQFLERGGGWRRPGVPMQLGRYLRAMGLQEHAAIIVTASSYDWGAGARSWSEYWWTVEGLDLQSQSISGTAALFGGVPDFVFEVQGRETTFTHRSGAVR